MISTQQMTMIDPEELKEWLSSKLLPHFPKNTHISIIPQSHEARGESRFFCEIDIDTPLSLTELMARVVSEHSRGNYVHFYAKDAVAAAVKYGVLEGDYFGLYYKW